MAEGKGGLVSEASHITLVYLVTGAGSEPVGRNVEAAGKYEV